MTDKWVSVPLRGNGLATCPECGSVDNLSVYWNEFQSPCGEMVLRQR